MSNATWLERYQGSIMNTFGTPKRVLVRGGGCFVWDQEGRRYLDLLGGIAVNALGHAHERIIETLEAQASTLGHVSNFFASQPQIMAAEKILEIIEPGGAPRGSRVFFTNSGTESNEAAMKIARVWGGSERNKILALKHGFHGRTLGSLSATHKPAIREPFAPFGYEVEFLEPEDVGALAQALGGEAGRKVAAIFIEVIQGEAGVMPLSDEYVRKVREWSATAGALMVVDEVQTGVGRTGAWMAHHRAGVLPDVVTLAKGLGAGFPVGACVTLSETLSRQLGPGMHGSTFAGNPLAAATVCTVLDTLKEEDLVTRAGELGTWWAGEIAALGHPLINNVRGRGLLLGIGLNAQVAPEVADALLEAGFIVNAANPYTLRLAPPLIINVDQARTFTNALPQVLDGFLGALAAPETPAAPAGGGVQ